MVQELPNTIEELVESYFPEPEPGARFHTGWFLLGVVALIAGAGVAFLGFASTSSTVRALGCSAVAFLPGIAFLAIARMKGARSLREDAERYPERRAELLAGRVASFTVAAGPTPGLGATLTNGDSVALTVPPDMVLAIRRAFVDLGVGRPRADIPSEVPELRDIAELYVLDVTHLAEFARGDFSEMETIDVRLNGTSMGKTIRMTLHSGSRVDVRVAPWDLDRVSGVLQAYLP